MARFAYRQTEWQARITGGKSVAYTITRRPGRAGVYLTAAWATPPETFGITTDTSDHQVLTRPAATDRVSSGPTPKSRTDTTR